MGPKSDLPSQRAVWAIASGQHERITYRQLLELGFHPDAIKHRVARGRLFRVARGVYALGMPHGNREERWITAVLSCGPHAVLSHSSAAALWGIGYELPGSTEVSFPAQVRRRRPSVTVHRRALVLPAEARRCRNIPVTSPALTLIDNARRLGAKGLEAAVSEADARNLVNPEKIRATAARYPRLPGAKLVRETLDRQTFRLTDSQLERMFLRIVRDRGFPMPETQWRPGSFRVDFLWPDLGLIAETDSLRYHRTAAQQTADRRRDHEHLRQGLTTVRFTHAQIRYEPQYVTETLAAAMRQAGRSAPVGVPGRSTGVTGS